MIYLGAEAGYLLFEIEPMEALREGAAGAAYVPGTVILFPETTRNAALGNEVAWALDEEQGKRTARGLSDGSIKPSLAIALVRTQLASETAELKRKAKPDSQSGGGSSRGLDVPSSANVVNPADIEPRKQMSKWTDG